MLKVNFLADEVKVPNVEFSKAINSNREFGISANGEIHFDLKQNTPYIFSGKANMMNKLEPLGKGYKIKATFVTVSISFNNIWNRIVEINRNNAMYEDSASDGIAEFQDKELEQIGWHGVEFKLSYRDFVEFLEKNVSGTILCIEQESPYMFNGLGFIQENNLENSRKKLFDFVKSEIQKHIDTNSQEYKKYGFSHDQQESLKFFGLESK